MWIGEQITERGIGNGISLIIFASIVSGIPERRRRTTSRSTSGDIQPLDDRRGARGVILVDASRSIVFFERAPAPDPDPVRAPPGRPPRVRRADARTCRSR